MNDEIKKILEYLKDKDDYIEDIGISYKRIHINNGDLKTLLDYITNLQQERDTYKEQLRITHKDLETYIRKYECLQEENDDLKNKLENEVADNNLRLQENERLKQPQVFIDTQDMEERYGEELYKDYLKEQLENYKQENESLRTRIKTIKRLRKKQTQKKNKYKSIIFDEEQKLKDYKQEIERQSKAQVILDDMLVDYKYRIDRAIELLQNYGNGTFDDDLLNILQNGSEEK